ncbi:MAG: SRPBCC family protein [Gemmatimonadetes bacterium]|nr:SRPBCC family protein [Gemmatimonadota bacterium]
MSTLKIEERFTLTADPTTVWRFLTDPERVVSCLPGAELTGRVDDRTYEGSMKVSAGPVTVAYRGTAVFEEIDEDRRYVRVVGQGRERSGSGNASMTMESRVEGAEGGGAAVSVTADVRVTGKIVRFGRGMIESVSAELFSDFRKRLEDEVGGRDADGADRGAQAVPLSMTGAEPNDSQATAAEPEALPAASADSLALVPLLWRAFKRWLGRLFR